MALVISTAVCAGCSDSSTQSSANSDTTSTVSQTSTTSNETSATQTSATENSNFADGDYKDVTSEDVNATITLSGNEGTISDTTRGSSGSEVTITSKGTYKVTGSSENVTITVDDSTKSGNIYLILDNVSMKNSSSACINIQSCDKVIIQCVGENTIECTNSDSSAKIDGAIYAKDDVTINGEGSLNVTSSLHGIVCKNDLKITGSKLTVNAENIGIQADDSVKIGGGDIEITSGHDGIQLSNDDNTSLFYISDGSLYINAGYDGISVKAGNDNADFTGYIDLAGGTVDILAGGGSDNSKNSDTSQKGVKCDGDILMNGTTLTVSSADDAVHGNADITVNSGSAELSTSDDGLTATGTVTINDGSINIIKSYEGIEAQAFVMNNGGVWVVSSDDGINTAGGSDTSSNDDTPWGSTDTSASLTINGGYVYVNTSGDGLDSNGSIYITGGTTIVEGPTTSGNGALDKGDSNGCVASITGGTVLALGTTDMAVNFDTGSQCSALVNISGESGTEISVNDGSDFKFTATKNFACAVYSSPNMTQGNSYTLTAGSNTANMDFTSDLYYSDVQSMGGGRGPGGPGGFGR